MASGRGLWMQGRSLLDGARVCGIPVGNDEKTNPLGDGLLNGVGEAMFGTVSAWLERLPLGLEFAMPNPVAEPASPSRGLAQRRPMSFATAPEGVFPAKRTQYPLFVEE